MRTIYRKDYPYYGKYKCKVEINGYELGKSSRSIRDINIFLNKNINYNDYKSNGWYSIYFKEDKDMNIFVNEFSDHVYCMHIPAEGYENLTGKKPKTEKILWHNKFPYKIVINVGSQKQGQKKSDEIKRWCDKNLESDFSKTGLTDNVSFFFISYTDMMAFKLTFSDIIKKQIIPDEKKVKKELKKRIKDAKLLLAQFTEGVS